MNFNFKKMFPKLLLFFVITIVIIILIFSLNDIQEIGNVLSNVEWKWLFFGLMFLVIYILVNPISLFILGKSKEEKPVGFKDSMLIGTVEYFFNGITPFSSGGQPFQVYAYNKIGVKASRSTGILLMNFVSFQIALVLLCLLALIYYPKLTNNTLLLEIMVIIGLAMNFIILTLFTSLGTSKFVRKILSKFVSWFCQLRIFKGKLNKFITVFEEYCYDAQRTFQSLLKHKLRFIGCILIKVISLLAYYTIPFFILKALNVDVSFDNLPLIIAMTTFSTAMTCYIPTPGASGGIEFAFQTLFMTVAVMDSSVAASGMLLWRFMTYYLLMLISFIFYIVFEKRAFGYKKEEIIEQI